MADGGPTAAGVRPSPAAPGDAAQRLPVALIRTLVGRITFVAREGWGMDALIAVAALAFVVASVLHATIEPSLATAVVVAATAITLISAVVVRLFTTVLAVAVLGVALGVASLVTVLAVTRGFEHAIVDRLTALNGHVLVSEYGLDFDEHAAVAARLREDERVRSAAPFVWGTVAYAHEWLDADAQGEREVPPTSGALHDGGSGGLETPPTVASGEAGSDPGRSASDYGPLVGMIKGVDPALSRRFRGFADAFGACDPEAALRPAQPNAAPTIALGRQLALRLGVVPGDRVRVVAPTALDGTEAPLSEPPRTASFEVTCTLDTGLSEFDERLAFVHLTAAQALLFGEGRVTGVELELHDPNAATTVARDAELVLHRPPFGDPTLPPRFRAGSWVDQVGGVLDLVRQIRTVVSLVLMLLLVVAGGALVSALLLLVRRHRHLLAVLGMLGTPPRVVFLTFEAVGVLAGLVGSMLGALLGLVLVASVWRVHLPLAGSVYPIDHLPVRLGVLDFVWPIGLALLVCSLVSGPIAWSAVRPQPLDA